MKEGKGSPEAQGSGPLPQKITYQQQQNTNLLMYQHRKVSNEEFSQKQQMNGPSGKTENQDTGEQTRSRENCKKEATFIWELANQLGAIVVEDQGRMVEKFMAVEERDRKEAEKVENTSYIL